MLDQINAPADKAITSDNIAPKADMHDAVKSLSDFNTIFKPENKGSASLSDMQTGNLYAAPQQGDMGSPNNNAGAGDSGQNGYAQGTETPSGSGEARGNNDGQSDGKGPFRGDDTPPPSSNAPSVGKEGFDGKNLDGKDSGFAPPPSHKLNPGDISLDKKDVPAAVPRLHQNVLPHFELKYD